MNNCIQQITDIKITIKTQINNILKKKCCMFKNKLIIL